MGLWIQTSHAGLWGFRKNGTMLRLRQRHRPASRGRIYQSHNDMTGGKASQRKGRSVDLEWRIIPELPVYEISSFGDIRRIVDCCSKKAGAIIRGYTRRSGYRVVNLVVGKPGQYQSKYIHRLVATAFHGEPPTAFHEVAHWDGDKQNNHYTNLRWATRKENNRDKIRQGRSACGSRHGGAKLTEAIVRVLRERVRKGEPRPRLAKEFNVSRSTILRATNGDLWSQVR